MKFGDYLKLQRESKGWNQKIAADQIKIEQSYLSKLETGKSIPSEETFQRLISALDINMTEMSNIVVSADLQNLKEIGTVRSHLLGQQKVQKKFVRGWLIAGLISLILFGLNIGLVQVQPDSGMKQFIYESLGVLHPGEPLELYEIVFEESPCAVNEKLDSTACKEFDRRKLEITDRVAAVERKIPIDRGHYFIEDVEGGKRIYSKKALNINFSNSAASLFSSIFSILSIVFLLSTFGCFYIARRWN